MRDKRQLNAWCNPEMANQLEILLNSLIDCIEFQQKKFHENTNAKTQKRSYHRAWSKQHRIHEIPQNSHRSRLKHNILMQPQHILKSTNYALMSPDHKNSTNAARLHVLLFILFVPTPWCAMNGLCRWWIHERLSKCRKGIGSWRCVRWLLRDWTMANGESVGVWDEWWKAFGFGAPVKVWCNKPQLLKFNYFKQRYYKVIFNKKVDNVLLTFPFHHNLIPKNTTALARSHVVWYLCRVPTYGDRKSVV